MKFLLSLSLLVAAFSVNGQVAENGNIVLGKTISLNSKILSEKRELWIHLPAGYNATSKQRYPVVYLLDGDDHFASFTGMASRLSSLGVNSVCPDMIIVGITNTDRTRDLTLTHSIYGLDGNKNDGLKNSGGGENFTAFIEKELLPHIDSLYATTPYKILVGHSFGGLALMNIVVNHPGLFNAYVAIDPSMWWDYGKLTDQAREMFGRTRFDGKSLFLAIANTMPAGMDTMNVRTDTNWSTRHIRTILKPADILKSSKANGLNFSYKYYNEDNHGSVPLLAEYDAIHFLFSYYKLPLEESGKFYDRNAKVDIAVVITNHYANISSHIGYTVLPAETMVDDLGKGFLQFDYPERAFSAFNLNLQNYPGSFKVYESMGDYYIYQKDKEKAIEFYNRALKLNGNAGTRKKLDKLQAGN